MKLPQLIAALSEPSAYPDSPTEIEVRQTHISVVFLTERYAYKVKKPVDMGFLDFSTLQKRKFFCEEEVRLNRRLAPRVYLGVVPIARTPFGLKVEAEGDVLEWAVKMERLAEQATLQKRLIRGEVDRALVQTLAERVASFHAAADKGEAIASYGRFQVVAGNARENFKQSTQQIGLTVSAPVFERLQSLQEEHLQRLCPLMEQRADRCVPRDTHGDLHLDHIYWFPERPVSDRLIMIDCIEFNERFRFADPVADMAFLVMDFLFHNRADLARHFQDAYFAHSGDDEGRVLLPFYTAYRAIVRAKVEGFKRSEPEIPEYERQQAQQKARKYWLLALGALERPERRPCLLLIGGLPGTGKSTLARTLQTRGNFHLLRSDVIRKQLAGLSPKESARSSYGAGIYTPAWTEQTYAFCLDQAERLLLEGKRVIVDASFSQEQKRRQFLDLADRLAVPGIFLACEAEASLVRERLKQRSQDASDADWAIYEQAARHWEPIQGKTQGRTKVISTRTTLEQTLSEVLEYLRDRSLEA